MHQLPLKISVEQILKHPSMICTGLSLQDYGGASVHVQWSLGKLQDTPWAGRQPITGQHRETHRTNNQPHKHTVYTHLMYQHTVAGKGLYIL